MNTFVPSITRIQCPNINFYKNKELTDSLDRVFDLPEIKLKNASRGSQDGHGLSFAGHPYLSLEHLPGSQELINWIREQIDTPISFKRSWANRIFKGCRGKLHNHTTYGHADLVAILYVDVPTTGAELIFVNDAGEEYKVQPKSGELIIHDPHINHTVGEHTEDMVRTVFVFDIVYKT
jgi:hypothetical protein